MNSSIDKIKTNDIEFPAVSVYGFDGVNGSGKSHALSLLESAIATNGTKILSAKISGLGGSDRVQVLKDILGYREQERLADRQTAKHLEDHRRQVLFRLATRRQIKEYFKLLTDASPEVVLLDRTPLMTLVYVLSDDPLNPYIDEIKAEAFELTKSLNLNKIFLFDVDHLTSITRTLARTVVGSENPEGLIANACEIMGIPEELREELKTQVLLFVEQNPGIMPKKSTPWDLNPYSLIARESINYRHVLEEAREQIGIDYTIINSNIDLDTIVQNMLSTITNIPEIKVTEI